jgi:hypothetical protein
MRRKATLLATLALMVVFSSGVALAAYEDSITGTDHTDILSGKAERISGLSGGDIVRSRDAPAVKDTVECGPGTVYADEDEVLGGDCERVKAWQALRPALVSTLRPSLVSQSAGASRHAQAEMLTSRQASPQTSPGGVLTS